MGKGIFPSDLTPESLAAAIRSLDLDQEIVENIKKLKDFTVQGKGAAGAVEIIQDVIHRLEIMNKNLRSS